MATDSLGSLKQRWEVCKWKNLRDISKSNGLRHEESCQSGGGDRRRNSKQHANHGGVLKETFWKEADPGPACFPAFPRAGWPGEGWEEPLCVWQTVGSELKRLLNKKIAFYKQVFKLWFPIRALIKAPVCLVLSRTEAGILLVKSHKKPFEGSLWERGHAQSIPSFPREQPVCATHLCLEPHGGCLHCGC